MPPLNEMLKVQSLKGFEAVENPPSAPPTTKSEEQSALNPYLRCPLPPFSTTVDTIRQWNMTGKNPVMRVIPLPTQQGAGGGAGSNITNVTTTTSGSGGGSTTPTTLTPLTKLISVPFLAPGQTFNTIALMAKSFQLLQLGATQPVETRIYSNAATQSIDSVRTPDASVDYNQIEGVITDIIFDHAPFQWNWENRIGANADSPQTTNIYITIVNPSSVAGTAPTTVTIVYLPLES
jgi:hypothetical protein